MGGTAWHDKVAKHERFDLPLCALPSEGSVQFIPPAYSSEAVQSLSRSAAVLSARGCCAQQRQSRAVPAGLSRRPGLGWAVSAANNTRAPLRALISAILDTKIMMCLSSVCSSQQKVVPFTVCITYSMCSVLVYCF